jgi:hypothetical protein
VTGLADYLSTGIESVDGWMHPVDAHLFARLNDAAPGPGDLLEIGCYMGQVGDPARFLVREDEAVEVCDPFEEVSDAASQLNVAEQARWYGSLSQAGLLANWHRFHDRPPVVHVGYSSELDPLALGRRFRVVHIDGSHLYDEVKTDIALTRQVTRDDAVVVLDDVRNPHTAGVAAAAWEAVLTGGLIPAVYTTKLYAAWDPRVAERLRHVARSLPGGVDRTVVAGHEVAYPRVESTIAKPPTPAGTVINRSRASAFARSRARALIRRLRRSP